MDAYASEMTGRPAEEDGKDEEQSVEEAGEDDEQPAEEDGELSLPHVLGYQYQPRVSITLTNGRLHYGVPIPGPGTAWLAPSRFSHAFNRNLTLLMNDDRLLSFHYYYRLLSLSFRRVDTHDWIFNHRPPPSGEFHTGMVYQPEAKEHTINPAALRMHMRPHMLESLLAEWPQPILRIFNIQHGEAWLLHLIGASSDGSLTIRHDPNYILRRTGLSDTGTWDTGNPVNSKTV